MNISDIALQIKTYAPIFAGNVAGAARYEDGVADQAWLPMPAAYVIPGDDAAAPNTSDTGLDQVISERVAVVVVLDTKDVGGTSDATDRRGQAASSSLLTIRAALFSAILNWLPPNTVSPRSIYYVGGELIDFDRARFFYRFTFGLDTFVTDAEGWQPPSVDLIDVRGTLTLNGPGLTGALASIIVDADQT